MRFFDRKYLLQIGDANTGKGLSINDLQLTFKVRKSANNKKKIDRCSISVYNLSEESLAFLETDYPVAVFSCGYRSSDDLVRLFYGEVTEVDTKKQGTDRITTLDIVPAFSDLTFKIMSGLVPEGGTVEDVIEKIRKETKLSRGVYKGANLKTPVVYGYPLSGTPSEMINRVCEHYNLEWKIEGESLFINDTNSVESEVKAQAPVISPKTGLIDRPYYTTGSSKKSSEDKDKKDGAKFKALLNPNILPGRIVRIDYEDQSEYYRVEEVEFTGDFRGSDWYMDCLCSKRPEA